ncbi:hypothetical protein QAD02_017456 [Eretmocerus hayati]|uniref:Uncharacterized protein n=1 Tax=Eretmocerus hayati TaxID=131215 RepID=A0ACC2PGF5_9HYME|nr:hypothetical protein QAD02_017456 [Eretmocerus hayati]
MESWELLLQSILNEGISKVERKEVTLMKHLMDDTKLKSRLTLWLSNLAKNKTTSKNEKKSEEMREQGNKKFKCKDYISSVGFYNLSLQSAFWGSENFLKALGNRSAALFYMEQYEACVSDIKLALKNGYPFNILYKLHLRAAQSYSKLQQRGHMEEILNDLKNYLANNHILPEDKKKEIEDQMNRLFMEARSIKNHIRVDQIDISLPELAFGDHLNFSYASAALDLKFSGEKGRYVISNRDIRKGQVLFVEKPFAFVLLDHQSSGTICANCCKLRGFSPIPCKRCTSTVYCSSLCQDEAWSTYHQWECFGHQTRLWEQIGIAHLALRTYLNYFYPESMKRLDEVNNLVTNIDKIPIEDLFAYGVSALMMALYLEQHTNFFQSNDFNKEAFEKLNLLKALEESCQDDPGEWIKNSKSTYYASVVLLQSMLQLVCNGHAITKLKCVESDSSDVLNEYQSRVATAIYPSASMMNHSCNPNIINSFKDQYLIVKAMRDIPVGDEVFNCYGPHFRRMGFKDRQEALLNQYCFHCKCEACTKKSLRNFSDKFTKLTCIHCSGPAEISHGSTVFCLECQNTYKFPEIKLCDLEKASELFDSSLNDMQSRNFSEALRKAKLCLQIRENHLFKYHESIAQTFDLIGQIFAMKGQWLDSLQFVEDSIIASEERFGCDSVELANECNKVTDLCLKYLSEESETKSIKYKEVFTKTQKYLKKAEQIFKLNYGPWNDSYREIMNKQDSCAILLSRLEL